MLQAAKYIGAGLATIGLTKTILSPVLSPRLLCPSVISSTAKVAIRVVDEMLRSLPENSPVLNQISVNVTGYSTITRGYRKSYQPCRVLKEAKQPTSDQTVAGQAFGSTIDFRRRLGDQFLDKHPYINQVILLLLTEELYM